MTTDQVSASLDGQSPATDAWERDSLIRNLSMDLCLAVSIGVMLGLVSTLLPPLGRTAGLDVVGLSLLAALPYLAAVVGMSTTRIGPRLPRHMFLILSLGCLPAIVLVAWPTALPILLLAFTCWTAYWVLVPYQLRLWSRIYPADRLGRFISILGVARVAAGAVGIGIAGSLAELAGGPTAIALGLALAVVLALAAFGFHTPRLEPSPRIPVARSVRAFLADLDLRRLAVAQVVWGIGAGAALTLYPLVQIDRLGMSLRDIGLVGVVAAIGAVSSYPLWGWLADRRGGVAVLVIASAVGTLAIIAWALADGRDAVLVATALVAVSDAGLGVGQPVAIRERSAFEQIDGHQAAWNGLVGVRGAIAPFLLTVPLALGLVDATGAMLLGSVASAIGCLLFVAAMRKEQTAA